MRKIGFLLLSILLSVSLVGCGQKSLTSDDSSNESQKQDESKELLPYTYNVPLRNIYVDVPNYQEIEQGYTRVFIVHEKKYVTFTSVLNAQATDAKDAYNKSFDTFRICMQNYESGPKSFNIVTDQTMTINGIDVYYFEGTIRYGEENPYDTYGIGYSFIMDGIPCAIIGSVTDKDQPEELKEEIKAVVNAMMLSVRSEM